MGQLAFGAEKFSGAAKAKRHRPYPCRESANQAMSRGTMALGQSQRVKFERPQLAAVRKELDQEYEAMAGLDAKPSKDGNPAFTENAAED